jgi:hypothetical protein
LRQNLNFHLFDWTYVMVARCKLLSLASDVCEGATRRPLPIVHCTLQIVHGHMGGNHHTYTTFWKILWIILGRTIHPLDHYVYRTRRTLGLANIYYFFRELVAPLSYKYPYSHSFSIYHFHLLALPQADKIEFL